MSRAIQPVQRDKIAATAGFVLGSDWETVLPRFLPAPLEQLTEQDAATVLSALLVVESDYKRSPRTEQHVDARVERLRDELRKLVAKKANGSSPPDAASQVDPVVWAAQNLGLVGAVPCPHCHGSGKTAQGSGKTAQVPPLRDVAAVFGAKSRAGLLRVLQDPPLSVLRKVAKLRNSNLGAAVKFCTDLHSRLEATS